MPLVLRILTTSAIVAYAVTAVIYAQHGLDTNPQYDNQGMFYAQELIEELPNGHLGQFLLKERKYPLGHTLPFAVADGFMLLWHDEIPLRMMGHIARTVVLLFSLGTFIVLWRIGRRLEGGAESVLLLMTSLLFLLFTSAIRPHVPVTFWTLLTLLASIRLREHPTPVRTFLAFACAGCAFATLQNGLLAFLFPVWALLERPISLRQWITAGAWLIGSGIIAAIVGYPFIMAPLFGGSAPSVDLGHEVGLHFNLLMPLHWGSQLLGGDIIVLALATYGLWRMRRDRSFPAAWMGIVCAYIALYLVIFALHTSAAGRFFMPLLPLCALVAMPSFLRMRPQWRTIIPIIVLLVCAKFSWLALQPNTYQQVSTFIAMHPGKVGTVTQPAYFFTIPEEKRVVATDAVASIPMIVIPDYRPDMQEKVAARTPCFHAVSSRTTDDIVLLWNDTPLALWHLFEAISLGPNMTVFCLP